MKSPYIAEFIKRNDNMSRSRVKCKAKTRADSIRDVLVDQSASTMPFNTSSCMSNAKSRPQSNRNA